MCLGVKNARESKVVQLWGLEETPFVTTPHSARSTHMRQLDRPISKARKTHKYFVEHIFPWENNTPKQKIKIMMTTYHPCISKVQLKGAVAKIIQ